LLAKALLRRIEHDEAVFHVVKGLLLRTDDWRPDDKYKNRTTPVKAAIRYLDKFKDDKAKTRGPGKREH
jgi:hypothetical protein